MDKTLLEPLHRQQIGHEVSLTVKLFDDTFQSVVTGQCCKIDLSLQHGYMASIYRWILVDFDDETPVLKPSADASWHLIPRYESSQILQVVELCSGMAGTSMGAKAAGMVPVLACDRSALACEFLRLNHHPCVVHGDLADINTVMKIHDALGERRAGLIGGFPCQPFSRLGNEQHFHDARADTFYRVLETAIRLQSVWVLLECVKPAGQNNEVKQTLKRFAEVMNFQMCEINLHLHRTWPAHRARWWVLLVPCDLALPPLRDLPWLVEWQKLEDIIPEWAIWPQSHEDALLLNEYELGYFLDERYGQTDRGLNMQGQAPTLLHNLGSQLFACPCGCRRRFSEETLLRKGLHGITICSQLYPGKLRHPHPLEAALMAGIPGFLEHDGKVRELLTQVGQVASPIQSHWVLTQFLHAQSQVDADFPWQHAKVMPTPEQLHRRFLRYVLRSHQLRWPSSFHHTGRVQCVQPTDEPGYSIVMRTPTTAQDLVHAHRAITGTNELLLAYTKVNLLGPADLLPEATIFVRAEPLIGYGNNFDLKNVNNTKLGKSQGLDDLTIHQEATMLMRKAGADTQAFWTPRFCAMIPELQQTTALHCLREIMGDGKEFHSIFLDSHHWLYIHFTIDGNTLTAEVFDGARRNTAVETHAFIQRVFLASRCAHLREETTYLVKQTQGTHCGAVALLHLGFNLSLWDYANEANAVQWHQHLLQKQDRARFGNGYGGGNDHEAAVKTWLANFLPSKGVAADAIEQRIRNAIAKLGVNTLYDAIHSQNPWKQLKQAGMGQGKPYQWVTAAELEAHVQKRSEDKFKTQKDKQKQKKKQGPVRKDQVGLHLTPENLMIPASTFVDSDDKDVPMISFQQIGSDARGVAICTIEQASKLTENCENLSIDALAVVTIGRMNVEEGSGYCVAHLQWPAVYTPTGEPILLNGTLLSLGDDEVSYKTPDMAPELSIMDTKTLKLQQFRDQYDGDWSAFVAGPVKALVQGHPSLQRCKEPSCNGACPRFHPAVEEETEVVLLDVWAWRWADVTGKPVQQRSADLFTVYVRTPESAVPAILAESGWNGYYVEPRAATGSGTDVQFAVVWLPKMTWDDAIAYKRKHEQCLGLARVNQKLGLRVKKADEKKMLQIVFPGRTVIACEVTQTFEVGPLPTGTSKAHMISLLAAWQWEARPLKPSRSTTTGKYWEIGTSVQPPSMFLHTDQGPVTVTLKRHAEEPQSDAHHIFASTRTTQHIKKTAASNGASSSSNGVADPWQERDPWQMYRPQTITTSVAPPPASGNADASKKRLEEVECRIRKAVQQEMDEKMASLQPTKDDPMGQQPMVLQLQTDVKELQAQTMKFEGWFRDVHTQLGHVNAGLQAQEQNIQNISMQQAQNQQQMEAALESKMEQQTSRIEALLEKRFRSA